MSDKDQSAQKSTAQKKPTQTLQTNISPEIGMVSPDQLLQRAQEAPHLLTQANVVQLQRTVGNKEVINLLKPPTLMRKGAMTINEPNDAYEQEADKVADAVMRKPTIPKAPQLNFMPEADVQAKGETNEGVVPEETERRIQHMNNSGQALPDEERTFFEERMDTDLSQVRIHTDNNAVQASREVNARAFTVGHNIAFNQGEYAPGTENGRHLMAHELTHVLQQTGTPQRKIQPKLNLQTKSQPISEYTSTNPPPSLLIQLAKRKRAETEDDGEQIEKTEPQKRGIDPQVRQSIIDYYKTVENIPDDLMSIEFLETTSTKGGTLPLLKNVYKEMLKLKQHLDEKGVDISKPITKLDQQLKQLDTIQQQIRELPRLLAKNSPLAKARSFIPKNASNIRTYYILIARDQLLEQHPDALPHLDLGGAMYQDKTVDAKATNIDDYHTGEASDPIPIIWYKAPENYKDVTLKSVDHAFDNADKQIAKGNTAKKDHVLNVDNANKPKIGWEIQKGKTDFSRANQVDFNKALTDNGFKMNDLDGDHVLDLGFGGHDTDDNYWPLDSKINRRAFNGYNAGYVLHYKSEDGKKNPVIKAKAIGGLIGKWFTVKGFLNSGDAPIPAESHTPDAGKK